MKGAKFTPEQRAEYAELFRAGHTVNQIAKIKGRSPGSITSMLLRDGVLIRRKVNKTS